MDLETPQRLTEYLPEIREALREFPGVPRTIEVSGPGHPGMTDYVVAIRVGPDASGRIVMAKAFELNGWPLSEVRAMVGRLNLHIGAFVDVVA
jgi:hypothetical protein